MHLSMYSGVVPGRELLGIALATALALLAIPVVALWWWWHPPRRPVVPAAVYLAVTLVCTWRWPNDPINETFADVGFGLLTPWSILFLYAAATIKADITWANAVAGALMNAALIYGTAALARWRKLRVSGRAAGDAVR